jgi:hydroxypyruvate isomerase
MLKIDLCIDPVFVGTETGEKIRKIAKLGYKAIEFWFWDHEFNGQNLVPKKKNIKEIASICKDLGITVNDIVVNSPDGSIGGFLTKRTDQSTYLQRLEETIAVAQELNCSKMITCTGNLVEGISFEEQQDNILSTLTLAADLAHKEGMTLLLEALNSTVDHPGYFLTSSAVGFDIVKKINSPHLRLLYDIYHMQIMEGNHIASIQKNIQLIGHFHAAGVPGRDEIYLGEINYLPILKAIDDTGYNGFFGLEYWPTEPDEMSLTNSMAFLKSYSEIITEVV